MGKPRSLVLSISVDRAKRTHSCQSSSRHVIAAGDLRLKVSAGRRIDHYCVVCAQKSITLGVAQLRAVEKQLAEESAQEEAAPTALARS